MLCVFKIIEKKSKMKYLPKREGASSKLRKKLQQKNLVTQYYAQIVGLLEGHCHKALDSWGVSQQLRDAVLKGKVDLRARGQVMDRSSNVNAKFQFIFWNTTRNCSF